MKQTNYNFSFWENDSFLSYDFIIIGGGLVGLHTSIALRNKHKSASILIVEKGFLPTGASTKNAGFACMGSASELLADLKKSTEAEVLDLFAMRQKGLADTRALLGDDKIGYQQHGSFELLTDKEMYALDHLDHLNSILYPLTNTTTFSANRSIINTNNFNTAYYKGAIENNLEGELHTGKLLKVLVHYAMQIGIEIKTSCTVETINEQPNKIILQCQSQQELFELHCQQIIICTNAFTNSLIPDVDITPGRGQVIITKPINSLPFKGIYHADEGYYYFRTIGNRVLFGGGRNLDFATEAVTNFQPNALIINHLTAQLRTNILPNIAHEIDYSWSGIMAFGNNKNPIITKHTDRQFLAVRCGGMGVAIGSEVARKVVALI